MYNFSIGSNNLWSFEEGIFERANCRVETFDCTVNATVPAAIQSRVRFHYICIGDKKETKEGMNFATWEDLLQITGINGPPTFLKMDIEG